MWQYCSSRFPLDPKFTLNQLSCQQSQLLGSGLFVLRLRPSCLLSVTLCWCFGSVGHHIQRAALFIFGEELLFCMQTTQAHTHTHTHAQKDVRTHAGTCVYLASSCLVRPPPKPIPRGLVLNKERLWPTPPEFKTPSWQCEPWCVWRREKQMQSIKMSMFLCFRSVSPKQ